MKETVYKFFTAVLIALIFGGMIHSMGVLGDLNDYNYIKRAAKKNSGLAAAGYDIPAVSAKAPAEAMHTEPAPITAEELSRIYIDGIKFDFPCTLADIREHFDTGRYTGYYDEEKSKYTGTEILMKNGVGSYRISYSADSRDPSPEECIVKSIGISVYSEKYSPQFVAAGMDIFHTSQEEIIRLAALDGNEYLPTNLIAYPYGNDGYIALNFVNNTISYCEKDDPDDMEKIERSRPLLIKTELRLPEDYDAENVPEGKEKLRKFVLEYYDYEGKAVTTANDLYLTAYEFLAETSDEYNALYYELTEIESMAWSDSKGNVYDAGYLKVTADCYIEGYDSPVQTEMILYAGDRLGDALIIYIDF